MRETLRRWFRPGAARPSEPAPTGWDRVSGRQIPVVAEVRRLMRSSAHVEAVERAYTSALRDALESTGGTVPPGWTHPEILERGFGPEQAELVGTLRKLYAYYRRVHYGPPRERGENLLEEEIVGLLLEAYGKWPMWRLATASEVQPDVGSSPSLPESAPSSLDRGL